MTADVYYNTKKRSDLENKPALRIPMFIYPILKKQTSAKCNTQD